MKRCKRSIVWITQLQRPIEHLQITSQEKEMLSISFEAYHLEEEISCNLQRQADKLNGCIVSESE